MSTVTNGRVLFAGNVADFRTLARKFIPDTLADRLADIITKSPPYSQSHNHFEETEANKEYGEENREDTDRDGDREAAESKRDHVHEEEESEDEMRERARDNRNIHAKIRTVQVNLDQLVEKVRERLLSDINKQNPEEREVKTNRGKKIYRPNRKESVEREKEKDSQKRPLKYKPYLKNPKNSAWYDREPKFVYKPKPSRTEEYENQKLNQEYRNKEIPSKKTQYRPHFDAREPQYMKETGLKHQINHDYEPPSQKRPIHKQEWHSDVEIPNRPRQNTKERVTEDMDMYKKTKLQIKGKHDSYEDYITPKKEEKIFESEEVTKPERYSLVPVYNIANIKSDSDNSFQMQKERKKTQEYEDYPVKTTKAELKARTENIGNSKESRETMRELIENIGAVSEDEPAIEPKIAKPKKVKVKKTRIGTGIPTRLTYKMSSPNYYAKLPTTAQKYDFEEPIPDNDREDENLKPIGNPPDTRINGRLRLD